MTPFLWTKPQNALKSVLGALFLLLLSFGNARATHLAAADISVRYIGPMPGDNRCIPFFTYEVTLDVYKACEENSSTLFPSQTVNIFTPSGCYSGPTLTLPLSNPQIDTLDQLCVDSKYLGSCFNNQVPRADGKTQPSFVRHHYIDTISLPYACSDWTFWWESGARNDGIANLANPGSQEIYVECMINNTTERPKINSPRFTVVPTPFLCLNKQSNFLNGPLDLDGDSIVILPSVAKTYTGAPAPILYQTPYTSANPVNSPSGYFVNPQTGSTDFIAPNPGKFVLAFRMFKYDRKTGVLLSHVDRDVQVAILPCVGEIPTITDPPLTITGGTLVQSGKKGNIITVCPGATLRFNIAGHSNSTQALLSVNDKLGSPIGTTSYVAQLNTNGFNNDVLGTFEYTPQLSEAGREYLKIFTVTDTSCGRSGQYIPKNSYLSMIIKVATGIEAGVAGYYCPTDTSKKSGYQIQVQSPDSTARYAWEVLPGGDKISSLSCSNCTTPYATPDSNTTYIVTATPTPYICKNKDTISILVNRIKINPYQEMAICQPGFVNLQSKVEGREEFYNLYCGSKEDTTPCTTPQTASIGFCPDTTLITTPFATANRSTRTQMLFQQEELVNAGMTNSSIRSVSFFVTKPSSAPLKNFSIRIGCSQRSFFSDASPFEDSIKQVYFNSNQPPLVAGWNTFNFIDTPFYAWDPSQGLVVDVCFDNGSVPAPGTASSEVRFSNTSNRAGSVLQSSSSSGSACLVSNNRIASGDRPNIMIDFCVPKPKPFEIYWTPGAFFRDSFMQNPELYVPKSLKVYAEVKGFQGCISRDSLDIIVAHDTVRVTPMDSLICPGDVAVLRASNSDYYRWFQDSLGRLVPATTLDCDSCPRAIVSPTKPTDYILVGYDYWGKDSTVCSDTVTASIRFKTPNRIAVTPKEVTTKYGDAVPLYAKNAAVYTWSPATGLNTTVGPSVIASPRATTRYIVTGLTDGCQSTDTSIVTVDRSTVVAMPNAFTPNGDNVNDFFMPMTTPTQRVVEFRIFNRWGNQVFYSTNATPGWDGNYNGQSQDGGTYSYMIRVTLPDGTSESLKGNVVLIR